MPPRQDCALTHTGNVRSNNEDALLSDSQHGLWVVADGMGGHEAGEVASAIVIDTIRDCIQQGKSLPEAIQLSHEAILDAARSGQGARGMGSTVVALKTDRHGYQVAWVGDSRAYLWTRTGERQGKLEQLSADHSYVQMLVDAGIITSEQADVHPDRNVITQCLGSIELETLKVDTREGQWGSEQWILLCSDGLTDELEDSQMAAILGNNPDIQTAGKTLLQAALDNGGRDNTTLILVGPAEPTGSLWDTMVGWLTGKR